MSNTQPKMTLRELAREYAGGRIDRQTFRRRRARLLDQLATGTTAQTNRHATQRPAVQPTTPVSREKQKSRWPLIAGIFALLLLLLAGGLLVFQSLSPPISAETPPSLASESETRPMAISPVLDIPVVQKPSLEEIIKAFVETNDWSLQSRQALLRQWNRYAREEQARAQMSSAYHALGTELKALIKEEWGLTGGKSSLTADSLIAFGTSLGLEYPTATPESAPQPAKSEKSGRAVPSPTPQNKPLVAKEVKRSNDPVTPAKTEIKAANKPAASPERHSRVPAEENTGPQSKQQTVAVETHTGDALVTKTAQADDTPTAPSSTPNAESRISGNKATQVQEESCRPQVSNRRLAKCRDTLNNGSKGPWLSLLPGGLYTMGSDATAVESPSHPVHIAYPFAMSRYEISQSEFNAFCQDTGYPCPQQPWQNDELPVVNVSWQDASRYAQWLTRQTGRGYRLPTESEWEYAARGGSTGPYPLPEADLGTYAHYSRHGRESQPLPHKPQRTNPNSFGLFHMAGNVNEWVIDNWSESYQGAPSDGSPRKQADGTVGVVRGGSYADDKSALRSSARVAMPQAQRNVLTGFRLVRDVYLKTEGDHLAKWGDWWLNYQPDKQFTLQLFAVNQLDRVSRLIEQYPNIAFKVTTNQGQASRYILSVGLFAADQDAKAAFQNLPKKLQTSANGYRIRSIGELRRSDQ